MPLEEDSQPLLCRCCKKEVTETDDFCPNCGFPLKGSEAEQGKFIGQYILKDANSMGNVLSDADNAQKGGNTLFVVAGLTVLGGVMAMFKDESGEGIILLITNIIVAAIYAGLGFWSQKNAFAATLVGLIMFVSLMVISAIIDPITIVQGILVKGLVIGYLIRGVIGATKTRNRA
jgi:hypothetical protein